MGVLEALFRILLQQADNLCSGSPRACQHSNFPCAPSGIGRRLSSVRILKIWRSLLPGLSLFGISHSHRYGIASILRKIAVEDHSLRHTAAGRIRRKWVDKEYFKQYTYTNSHGNDAWTTHRYQLGQFVNKVRGRKDSGVWIDGEDSIRQTEMIDQAYKKARMPLRPSSSYRD